jgi:hypothetical protein
MHNIRRIIVIIMVYGIVDRIIINLIIMVNEFYLETIHNYARCCTTPIYQSEPLGVDHLDETKI